MKIELVLDRSGSMENIRDATLDGLNEYMRTLKKDPNAEGAEVRLSTFDTDGYDVIGPKDIKDFPLLTKDDFVPRGGTPLYDAIGKAIAAADDATSDPVLMLIITDGYENSSREMTREKVKELIAAKEAKGTWTFSYIGANQDAWAAGGGMGIGGAYTYAATAQGTSDMFRRAGTATRMSTFNSTVGLKVDTAAFAGAMAAADEGKDEEISNTRVDAKSESDPVGGTH